MDSSGIDLRDKYRRIWEEARAAVCSGSYVADSDPVEGGSRWGISIVALLPEWGAKRIGQVLASLQGHIVGEHFLYRQQDLHATVRSLEGHRSDVPPEMVSSFADQMRRAVTEVNPIEVSFEGLCGSSGGVFACGYVGNGIAQIRDNLLREHYNSSFQLVPGGDSDRARDTFHVSLVVFKESGIPEPTLADFIDQNQNLDLGTGLITQLALVRYRTVAGQTMLDVLETVSL